MGRQPGEGQAHRDTRTSISGGRQTVQRIIKSLEIKHNVECLTLLHHRGHPGNCPRTRTPAVQETHSPACIPPRLCPAMCTLVHFFVQERFQRLFSIEKIPLGFPGGSVAKNPPADAGHTGSIPDPGEGVQKDILEGSEITAYGDCSHEILKDPCSLEENL